MRTTVATVSAAAVCAVVVGAAGGVVGAHLTPPLTGTAVSTAAPPPADEIQSQTESLCTRFATGYSAMPDGPTRTADMLATLTYIDTALADNPAADDQIRSAVSDSVRLLRGNAAWLSHEVVQGAVQPPEQWRGREGNVADQHVFDLCRAYGS